MRLDCDKYRTNIPSFKALLDDKSHKERMEHIGVLAVGSGVPIIVVCCYVGELYGFDTSLHDYIDRLKAFYNVDEVNGLPSRLPVADDEGT